MRHLIFKLVLLTLTATKYNLAVAILGNRELLKAPRMLKRLNDIAKFPDKDKECILYALDAMINNVKLKAI